MWNKVVFRRSFTSFVISVSLTGCTALSDCKYEVSQKIRTSQAWHEFDGCNEECFTADYRNGWKAGYYDVITGGEGRPPVIPPKKYWKPPVFFEHDPSRKDDWYCGFQDGAACGKSQPDHHFLPTFLPESCMPVVEHAYTPSSLSEIVPAGEDIFSSPAPEAPGISPDNEATPSEGPVNSPGKSDSQPRQQGQRPDYEADPEPPSSASANSIGGSVALTANSDAAANSLLQQLVQNASVTEFHDDSEE